MVLQEGLFPSTRFQNLMKRLVFLRQVGRVLELNIAGFFEERIKNLDI